MQRAVGLSIVAVSYALSCAPARLDAAAAQWRARLSEAIQAPVETREQRTQHSQILVDAIAHDALEQLTLAQVQAAFGQGYACSGNELCSKQGFSGDDLYYPVGKLQTDSIKQLPILIVGFDPHGNVRRVYTLRTD